METLGKRFSDTPYAYQKATSSVLAISLAGFEGRDLVALCRTMRATVAQWTGIPTCVGIAPTKTLAKLANAFAKKNPAYAGVCDLTDEAMRSTVLHGFPVEDVWGIGRVTAAKLAALDVSTAGALRDLDAKQARALGTVTLERTVRELQGVSCLSLEDVAPERKGMAVTRSFGRATTSLDEIREAVATYATRAGEKLRMHGLVTGQLSAFFHTSPHRDGPAYSAQRSVRIMPMTADTRELVTAAIRWVEAGWPGDRGCSYVKAGVILDNLCAPDAAPRCLFSQPSPRGAKLMDAMDEINARFGRNMVFPAAMGVEQGWKLRSDHKSPCYTTRIEELPFVRA